MKWKPIITLLASAVLMAAVVLFWLRPLPVLPRIPLRQGGEFRVVQITYTAQPSDLTDHNIGAAKGRLWIYRHLPSTLRQRIPEPDRGIGNRASTHPALCIWWAQFDPITGKPILGEPGYVMMTADSGKQTNEGWPSPADEYRQIFVIDPPADSKRLTFEFPVWGEQVRFSIDNPAYHP